MTVRAVQAVSADVVDTVDKVGSGGIEAPVAPLELAEPLRSATAVTGGNVGFEERIETTDGV